MIKTLLLTNLSSSLDTYSSYIGITLAGIIFFTLIIISIITFSQLFSSKNNDKEISISKNEFLLTNMFKHQSQERRSRAKSVAQLRSHKPKPTENYNHPTTL